MFRVFRLIRVSRQADRLIPVGVFSKPDRDMRAWVISNAFVSVHRRGQVAGAYYGFDAIPERWVKAVKTWTKVDALVERFLNVKAEVAMRAESPATSRRGAWG